MSKARLIEKIGAYLHYSGALEKMLGLSRLSKPTDECHRSLPQPLPAHTIAYGEIAGRSGTCCLQGAPVT